MSREVSMSVRDMRQAVSELLMDGGCPDTTAEDEVFTMDEDALAQRLLEDGCPVADLLPPERWERT